MTFLYSSILYSIYCFTCTFCLCREWVLCGRHVFDPAAERPVSEEPRPDAGGRGLFQTGLQQASASGFAFTNACSVSGWCLRCFVSLTVKRNWSLIITWFLTLCWRWVSCTSTRGGKSKPSIYFRKPSEFSLGQNTCLLLSFLGFSHFMQVANCIFVMKCSPHLSCQEKLQGVLNGVSYAVQGPCSPHQT